MKDLHILAAIVSVGLAGAVNAGVAPEKRSTLTISTAVEVPGAVLEPGTYVVKLVDAESDRNVVAFTSADETRVFATAIATPHVAADDAFHGTFVYYGTPEGSPRVLRTWFAQNNRYGQDFVYPAERAVKLREAIEMDVPVMTAEQSRDLADRTEPVAVVSDRQPLRVAVAPAADSDHAPPDETEDIMTMLPQTAGRTPFLFACGLLSLGVASALRFAGRG